MFLSCGMHTWINVHVHGHTVVGLIAPIRQLWGIHYWVQIRKNMKGLPKNFNVMVEVSFCCKYMTMQPWSLNKFWPWTQHQIRYPLEIVMALFGSEPKFKPELLRTGPKSSSRFAHEAKLNLKSSLRFGQDRRGSNLNWTSNLNRVLFMKELDLAV